jgi:hypothetical protein
MTVTSEFSVRLAQRARLARLFSDRPGFIMTAGELERQVGPNYRSRISELRRTGMDIENVPTYLELPDGTRQRGLGAYRYIPDPPTQTDLLFDMDHV